MILIMVGLAFHDIVIIALYYLCDLLGAFSACDKFFFGKCKPLLVVTFAWR